MIAVLAAGDILCAAQSRPDFSGTWTLVADRDAPSGEARGRGAGRGVVVSRASGAPVNCDTECTIVQDVGTIRISRPAGPDGAKPRDIVLHLDGRPGSTRRANGPIEHGAKWEGDTLIVAGSVALVAVTQTISLDNGRLRIAYTFTNPDGSKSSGRFTYVRKEYFGG